MRGFFLLVISLFVSCEPAFAQARFPFMAETVSERVNVRAGQNNNFESVAILPKGAALTVLDKKFKWYKVSLPAGAKAFVKSEYVKALTPELGEVTVDRLNVRSAPNTDATTVGQLKLGQKFLIQKNIGDWVWIKPAEGVYGWVNEGLLTFKTDGVRVNVTDPDAAAAVKASESRAEQVRKDARTVQLKKNADGSVECAGKLQKAQQAPAAYKIINNSGAVVCFVDGVPAVLESFVGSDVRLLGKIKSVPSDAEAAVVSLSKINLAL